MQLDIGLSGRLDPEALKQAWRQIVRRHPIFRTSFYTEQLRASFASGQKSSRPELV